MISVGLEGIQNILKSGQRNLSGDGRNPFVAVVEMCGGVDKIENFLNTLYVYLYSDFDTPRYNEQSKSLMNRFFTIKQVLDQKYFINSGTAITQNKQSST
jgi:hypothetical protein